MRSPLTEIIFKVQGMITYVRENLSTDEYMLFLDLLVPLPEPEAKPAKKTRKKSSKSSPSKSPRATDLNAQLNKRREQGRVGTTKDDNYDGESQCSDCGMAADMPIHSPEGGYITYHPFRSGVSTAPARSPANGGAEDESESTSAASGD